ncbi:MAG: anthranilate phosphoribosyltransferase [Alphaproteobacteria bacterium]|jgi:anthranilate phosphoribosyltransferase|nr:anthranilate phosphoribosyltransferase [Alphaproteobacteria bacterium]
MGDSATDFKDLIGLVAEGQSLSENQSADAFDIMMSGDATPSQIGGFLMALRMRGETVEEITGAARTMRAKVLKVTAPEGAMDVVGTGGDAIGTQNISTASALVVAGAGVPVAKHGNRAFSSKSGAADVLGALGVDLEAELPVVEEAIAEAGIGFLMAPAYHSSMRHVGPTRVEMGVRTIFNILGPLSNPALVKRLLVGTYDARWVEPMAQVLGNLGAERVWVVHGSDGLDEMTTTGPTQVAELADGKLRTFEVVPEDAGVATATLDDLEGGTPEENAAAIREVLAGAAGPFRDIVLLNAGAALVVAGKADDLRGGASLAAASIDGGHASTALVKLIAITAGAE